MTPVRDKLRLKLSIALVPILLALSNMGGVRCVFAHDKLVVAIQPSVSSDKMLKKARPLEKFLRDSLGGKTDVQLYIPTSYAGVVESLRFGHAHIAFMSAWPAQLAVQLGGAEVPLAEVRRVMLGDKVANSTSYFSYWVVQPRSPYKNLESLKGKSVCFPSPISTSGYVAPLGRMVELQLIPAGKGKEADATTFFKDVVFGGGYGQCWQALQQGQVDVTIIAGDVSERLYREVLASTRIVEEQGPIPSHAVVVSKELKEPLRSRAIGTISKLADSAHQSLMRSFISSTFVGFRPTTAAKHLGPLNIYLKLVGLKYTERL